uniref:Uncharacterized protein n=1 Tax=Roseihalotalea indica TaxID=2867963 RepID=A0AA49JJK1_9BACT|nr:hypothetical protein K4G66_14175 [Tunicatimonas sp. TK19036]
MKKVTYLLATTVLAGSLVLSSCDRGDDYKQNEDGEATASSGEGEFNEEEAMYPEEKVQDDTNLEDGEPLDLDSEYEPVKKRVMIASLLRQKNDLQNRIREIKMQSSATASEGDMGQMQDYVERIDTEITSIRRTPNDRISQVEKSAQTTIEEAGELLQSTKMRIDHGF